MRRDAARIQRPDTDFMNRKHRELLEEPVVPLYDEAYVLKTMRRFRSLVYHQPAPVLGEFARISGAQAACRLSRIDFFRLPS